MASLQAQYDISENGITYDQAINHLASIVTKNTMSNRFVNQVQVNPNMVIKERGDIQTTGLVEVKEFTMAGTTFEMDVVEEVAIAKGQKHGSLITNGVK